MRSGFNGAAPVRARKFETNSGAVGFSATLQRGRACEGAEILRLLPRLTEEFPASTGPRL